MAFLIDDELKNELLKMYGPSAQRTASTPTSGLQYRNLLKRALDETYWYARSGQQQKQDVADTVSPGGSMTAYNKGDVESFNYNTARQAEIDRVAAQRYMTSMGLFDDEQWAYNKGYVHLPRRGYLELLLPGLKEKIDASKADDEAWENGGKQTWLDFTTRQNAVQNKLAEMDAQGRNYYDTSELTEADLMWFDQIINGNARWRPNYANAADVDRYNALVDQWGGIDWDEFDLAGHLGIQTPEEYESKTDDLEKQYKMIEDEIARRKELEAFQASIRSTQGYKELSAFDGSKLPYTEEELAEAAEAAKLPQYPWSDDLFTNDYYRINHAEDYVSSYNFQMYHGRSLVGAGGKEYHYMTADEIADYNALYNAGRLEEAERYLELLTPELWSRAANVRDSRATVRAQDPLTGAADTVESIMGKPTEAFNAFVGGVTGEDNPNAPRYAAVRKNQITRDVAGNALGELLPYEILGSSIGKTIYNAAISVADMLFARKLGGKAADLFGGGKAFALNATQFVLSSGAASNTMYNDLERGFTAEQALAHGVIDGAIEWFTERGVLDKLFYGQGSFVRRLATASALEGLEEVEAGTLQLGSDMLMSYLFDHESQIETVYNDYVTKYSEKMSDSEAAKAASEATLKHFSQQIALEGFTGALSGGVLQGTSSAQNYVSENNAYRQVGREIQDNADAEALVRLAAEFPDNAQLSAAAETVRKKLEAGKKLGPRDLGRLALTLEDVIGSQRAGVIQSVLDESIEERLVEVGEDAGTAKALAPVVRRIFGGETLTRRELKETPWTDSASKVLKELTTEESADGRHAAKPLDTRVEEEGAQPKAIDTFEEEARPKPIDNTPEIEARPKPIDNVFEEEEGPKPIDNRVNEEEHAPKPIDDRPDAEVAPKLIETFEEEAQPKLIETFEEEARPKPIDTMPEEESAHKPIDTFEEEEARPKPIDTISEEEESGTVDYRGKHVAQDDGSADTNVDTNPEPDGKHVKTTEDYYTGRHVKSESDDEGYVGKHTSPETDLTAVEGDEWRQRLRSRLEERLAGVNEIQNRYNEALSNKTTTETSITRAVEKATSTVNGKPKIQTGEMTITNPDGKTNTVGEYQHLVNEGGKFYAVVKTPDGKTVKADVDSIDNAGNSAMLAIIDYAQDGSRHRMSAAEANVMIGAYKQYGGKVEPFIAGFEKAYLAGYSGINMPKTGLPDGIARVAYDQGKREAQSDEAARVERTKLGKRTSAATVGWLGEVNSDADVKGLPESGNLDEAVRSMTASQQNIVEFIREFAKQANINIVLFASKPGKDGKYTTQNGSYDHKTDTIYLDINAGVQTEQGRRGASKYGTLGDFLLLTMGHEVTHAIEAHSPVAYAKYKQAVKEALKERGYDWAMLVRKKINNALDNGQKLTYYEAEAEIVADASEYMLQESEFVQNMDKSLAGQVRAAVRSFIDKINETFRRLTNRGHVESRALREMRDDVQSYFKGLSELWNAGLLEMVNADFATVTEEGSERNDVAQSSTTAKPEIGEGSAPDGAHPMMRQLSTRQLAESLGYELRMLEGTDVPYAIVDSSGREVTSFTSEQIKNTPLGGLIEAAVAAGNIDVQTQQEQLKMIADLATLAAQYKDQAMVWEIAGSQLYSAIKNNSDKQYNKTVDFGTICSKTQAVVDVLSDTMLKLDRGLTREEVITAYNKTAKNGLSVPCGPCYVFSRWMGVPGLLNSMANYQKRFGGMTADEVTSYIDGVQARYSSDGERFSKVIGKQKTKLENRLESIASRMQKAMATGSDMTALFREADEVEREYADVEAYNWVTQVLCQSKRVKGAIEVLRDADGIVKLDPSYKPVPHSILFDMRRTGEFAKYPKSWKYRSTRGAGMGKSILPYSGASLGDTVYGEQKRRSTSQNAFLNPNMTKAQRIRAIKNATKRMKSQNLIGGHRFQSTSDYRPEWGLDYIMTFLEMQAVGAKGQLYTKVIEAVDMFATAGIEVNLSIMANGDGWHYDKNGKPVLGVEDFSSVSGIDFSEALEKTREYDNVQMILVGMNDTHIRLALADDRITFVIPWHSSGSSESVLKQLFSAVGEDLRTGSDYQEIQSDKPVAHPTEKQKQNMAIRTRIITGKFAKTLPSESEREAIESNEFLKDLYNRFYLDPSATDTYGVKLSSEQASQVFPYEYWDTSLNYKDADENGKRFVKYCESIGLVPRFEKFKGDHGYWKLLIDRRMYNRDGTYHTPEVIDVTGVKIGDIASSVSQAKYGDPVKTRNAVMETIEELRTKAGSPNYVEPSIFETMDGYGDEVDVDPRPVQKSTRDIPEDSANYRDYLAETDDSIAATVEERNALSIYQKLLKNHAEASEKVIEAENALAMAEESRKPAARKELTAARAKQRDIYDRLLKVERTDHVQTVVKRTNKLIDDLHGKTEADVNRLITDRESRIASLKADITGLKGAARTQREADIRAAEREIAQFKSKAAQALLATNERYQKEISDIRARRDMNLEIGKHTRHIKRIVKRLNDRIIHETDYKNVKEELKPAVRNLVQEFIDGFGSLVFDQKTAAQLKIVYDAIAKDDGAPDFYSDDVSDWLEDLSKLAALDESRRAEGSSSLSAVREKLETYAKVAEIADHIYKMVTGADEVFVDGKREKFSAISESVGNELVKHKDRTMLVGAARTAVDTLENLIVKGNMTPQYFFEGLGNAGIQRLFEGLNSAETKCAQYVRAGEDFVSDIKKKYGYYSWGNMKKGLKFRTAQGHNISLTTEQMMWVYATAKREATNKVADTHHLDEGGFVFDEKALPKQNAFVAETGSNDLHRLTKADVETITSKLTENQKAYADECVSYLSNECAEQGNEASMEMFGIKKYNETYYFPFRTASDQRYQRSDAGSASTTNDARVKHSSFTHALRKGANTTLVMGNFTDVITEHIQLMATYSSFVVAIESMNRVLNAKVNNKEDGTGSNVTIRSLIGRKYGEPAQRYIADLIKDLNGGPNVDKRGSLDAGLRIFKRSAVMGSLSVAVQQPTSIVRAFALVNPKHFVHFTGRGYKQTWKTMMHYSGTAVWKEIGGFNVGMGKATSNWIAENGYEDFNVFKRAKFLFEQKGFNAAKNNFVEFLTSLPGFMDKVTWTHIWKAVESEQAEAHPEMNRSSDEFLQLVGKRFDYVVRHTQVYDSTLVKSQNMRSQNAIAKISTAFMAEPTIGMNMYYSALTGKHTAKHRAGLIVSVILSNVLAAAAWAAVGAWNKDDDDRTIEEKYWISFHDRLMQNINPLASIPYLSDVWNKLLGYDVERSDLSPIMDIIDYTSSFIDKKSSGKAVTWKDYENTIGAYTNLTGIPLKNWSRDLRRFRNLIHSDGSNAPVFRVRYGIYDEIILGRDASAKAYCERFVSAVVDGDTQEAYDLWDYITNSKKPSQNTINSGVREALEARVREGNLSPSEATNILRKYAPYASDKSNVNKPLEWKKKTD